MLEELVVWKDDLRLTDTPSPMDSLAVRDLLDSDRCQHFLRKISEQLQTPSPLVTASIFSKRYAYSLVVSTLWSMSILNRGLPIQVDNCYLESDYDHGKWLPRLRIVDWQATEPGEDRVAWRNQLLIQLFADHLTPIWEQLHQITGIAKLVLWENTAIYIYWLYQSKLQDAHLSVNQYAQSEEDYKAILFDLDAYHFGERIQPMRRLLASVTNEQRKRKTCCLSYLSCGGLESCATCPRRRSKSKAILSK
ncbi:Ferric iron reductase protein FhuF, involved in iron transport [Seinonella peptonophila]|uniref:Ferric iron reductase protein FhuF, involved in iron transport n=1 Tax=Seinonella peptonophila TaxID=112248 RepID=A0A1M4Z2U6_9BACL|nr:IucA/IucC family C-terminal-domain containing protein [Seinonella peptonophila]SHF12393.1 Ferric iron reductase protein FhuF, involved in iron transport [Seinonella peptonophila]